MEVMQILHMNKGEGETSYAKNCTVQRQIISVANSVIREAVVECFANTVPESMGIADLGCSSGPNTLMVVSKIINTVCGTCNKMDIKLPELRVSLNDLPGNDFNEVLMSLPEFYRNLEKEKGIGLEGCFVSAVAGSFYGRLFPKKTLHFVHSSSCLHWLSQVPPGLDMPTGVGKHVNKGKIYISKTSPSSVVKAYLSQFEKDLSVFLRSRAEEIVGGGRMLLSFMGRISPDASARVGTHQWELLAQALMTMALEGLIEEEKIDTFNAPYYAPSAKEVRNVIEKEGSFIINHLEAFEIDWDEGCSSTNYNDYDELEKLSRGERVAKNIRAVVESMIEAHFGREIMDELFRRYGELIDDYFSKTMAKHINLVISVTRNY